MKIRGLGKRLAGVRRGLAIVLATSAVMPAEAADWAHRYFQNPVLGVTTHLAEVRTGDLVVTVRCEGSPAIPETRVHLDETVLRNLEGLDWTFDGIPFQPPQWVKSPNRQSLILHASGRDRILPLLMAYQEVALTLHLADSRDAAYTVPLSGSSAAIRSVQNGCR